ncbi:pyridoxamine 5'-phosphate oxidase family protein [Nocardia sp. NPDC050712]|uniref:pyridoxamine 5'-phosphate oxidase family protein n=1 Tax=Nocardia sp. NPDC050712 TaxID=3155518 RepID=UPI00340FDC01
MTETTPLGATARTTLSSLTDRARTDRADLYAVLDGSLVCHLGVLLDGGPMVLPSTYGRDGDTLYLHGFSRAAHLRAALSGAVSIAVTLVDGIVYARAAVHCSLNYRSAVIFARPTEVTDSEERLHGLRTIADHVVPGSWDAMRAATAKELDATLVLSVDLTEASVKVRTGFAGDEPADIAAGGVWAGVVPLRQIPGTPQPAPDLLPGIEIPAYVRDREV